jgi:hypothetical protein
MDVFSRYCSRVGVMTQTDIVSVDQRFHVTPRNTVYGNSPKNLGAIQQSEKKL